MSKYFVKHLCPLPPVYGGVTVYVKRLMFSLCKKNLFSGAFCGNICEGIPESFFHLVDKFPKHLRSFYVIPELPRLLCVFSKYKIIHAHTSLSTCFCVWVARKFLRKPIVYTIHNQMIDSEFSILNKLDIYCLHSLAKDSKVQFITVNEFAKINFKGKVNYFANDILVLPAYIPPVEIGSPKDYLSSDLFNFIEQGGQTILFYAENFVEYDGQDLYGTGIAIDLFIRLKDKIKDLKLIFCIANASRADKHLIVLQNKINQNEYDSDVFWQIGPVSEMWPLLKCSTFLLRPTNTDGDSVMIREALAYGLPVITSNVTKRPEGCLIFDINNMEELYSISLGLLLKPYRKTYPQTDVTDKMISIYNNLLK